jgi:hypothetical protein
LLGAIKRVLKDWKLTSGLIFHIASFY